MTNKLYIPGQPEPQSEMDAIVVVMQKMHEMLMESVVDVMAQVDDEGNLQIVATRRNGSQTICTIATGSNENG